MPRGMLMSTRCQQGGQYRLMSAVGPADVSVDRSMGSAGQWDPPVRLTPRLTGGALSQAGKRKGKGARLWFLGRK
jgi:hypothetical protein